MEFYEVIHSRRAVRKYKEDMVPEKTLLKILDAANWAPSGKNLQQWEFIVVSGEKKKELGESYGRIAEVYTADWEDNKGRELFLKFARTFGGAPVIIVALTYVDNNPETRKMHLESVSAALENLLLAACAEGLGTCWMTGPLQDETALRRILNIPEDREIVALTPVGFPEKVPGPPPRTDPEMKNKIRWIK